MHVVACGGGGGEVEAFFCGMKAEEAFQLDSKIDDGLPLSGKAKIHSFVYLYRFPGDVNNDVTGCNTIGTENLYISYSASRNNRRCNIAIDGEF